MPQIGAMVFLFYKQIKEILTFLSLTIVLRSSTLLIVGAKLLYLHKKIGVRKQCRAI